MIFVKNSRGGREVNMINTLSQINLSKIGWEGGGPTSIWIMSLDILLFFFDGTPKKAIKRVKLKQWFAMEDSTEPNIRTRGKRLQTKPRVETSNI